MQAKSKGNRQDADEVEQQQQAKRAAGAYILSRSKDYWLRFLRDGELDEAALIEKRYRPEQVSYIKAEMRRLKWLPH